MKTKPMDQQMIFQRSLYQISFSDLVESDDTKFQTIFLFSESKISCYTLIMFDTQTIVRCIFLFFIICLAAYFLVVNKNSLVEKFEEAKAQATSQPPVLPKGKEQLNTIVREIYAEIYKNDLQ